MCEISMARYLVSATLYSPGSLYYGLGFFWWGQGHTKVRL